MRIRRRDHYVKFVREENIAEIALEWRKAAFNENSGYFNITAFVANVLPKYLKKGAVTVSKLDRLPDDEPACVTYDPPTLHVNKEIWELADIGEPEARYIIAHEVGHIVLHDHDAKAFLDDPSYQIQFATKEYSAEWQANTFADYFLLPDHIIRALVDPVLIARKCSVPRALAESRVAATGITAHSGEACSECGNFTMLRDGARHKCDICGNTVDCPRELNGSR